MASPAPPTAFGVSSPSPSPPPCLSTPPPVPPASLPLPSPPSHPSWFCPCSLSAPLEGLLLTLSFLVPIPWSPGKLAAGQNAGWEPFPVEQIGALVQGEQKTRGWGTRPRSGFGQKCFSPSLSAGPRNPFQLLPCREEAGGKWNALVL